MFNIEGEFSRNVYTVDSGKLYDVKFWLSLKGGTCYSWPEFFYYCWRVSELQISRGQWHCTVILDPLYWSLSWHIMWECTAVTIARDLTNSKWGEVQRVRGIYNLSLQCHQSREECQQKSQQLNYNSNIPGNMLTRYVIHKNIIIVYVCSVHLRVYLRLRSYLLNFFIFC